MPPKIPFKIGGGALLLAAVVFSLSSYWFTTRTSEPLDETAFDFALLGCWLVAWLGAGGTLRAIVVCVQGALGSTRASRIFPNMVVPSLIRLPRHRPLPLIRDFPNFGLIHGFILWVLMFIFMIFQPRPSNGLPVNFKGERTVIVEKNPWAETMAVYIDGQQRFFVNGKQVPREELRSRLEEELLRRGVWVVYFEADGDCSYMNAVYAMDTIQSLGAKMIWITPKTREEWKKRDAPKMPGIPVNRIP